MFVVSSLTWIRNLYLSAKLYFQHNERTSTNVILESFYKYQVIFDQKAFVMIGNVIQTQKRRNENGGEYTSRAMRLLLQCAALIKKTSALMLCAYPSENLSPACWWSWSLQIRRGKCTITPRNNPITEGCRAGIFLFRKKVFLHISLYM